MTKCDCPLCETAKCRQLGPNPDFMGFNVLVCKNCGYMWTMPRPPQVFLENLYRFTYREERREEPTDEYLGSMDKRALSQREFILRSVRLRSNRSNKILDIGCGIGSLLRAFGDLSCDLTGYEPDTKMATFAQSRLPDARIIPGTFLESAHASGEFDLITASHVLEHIADPVSFLSAIFRILDDDGFVFLEVPHETKWSVIELIKTKYKGQMHLSFFNTNTLSAAVEKAGGNIVYMSTFGPNRDRFSLIDPKFSIWHRYWRWKLSVVLSRITGVQFKHPFLVWSDVDWDKALVQETPSSGIWIRMVARKVLNE